MVDHVVDRLFAKMDEKRTPLCVGLDPNLAFFPPHLLKNHAESGRSPFRSASDAILEFNRAIIDATADLVPVFKPQSAYYEHYGSVGIVALEATIKYAQNKGALVILDAKRNDIGSTAGAYAEGHLGRVLLPDGSFARSSDDADFMTINGYLGTDGVKPFIEVANRDGKGIFVLVKTSNESSGELQDSQVRDGCNFSPVYEVMANLVAEWGQDNFGESGYSNVGAVVGATYPRQAAELRELYPNMLFLMPGYGAQGAKAEILTAGFDDNGRGAVVNSSRGITYAFANEGFTTRHPHLAKPELYAEAARQATIDAIADINDALKDAGKLPEKWAA